MTGLRTLRVDQLKTRARTWLLGDGSGTFWWLASAVFAANGLVSAWQHNWWLAVMQIVTAMLAVRAAVFARLTASVPGDRTARTSVTTHSEPDDAVAGPSTPPKRT